MSASMLLAGTGLLVQATVQASLVALDTLSEGQVRSVLRSWNLDGAFGKLFASHDVDGFLLSVVMEGDNDAAQCDSGDWLVGAGAASSTPLSVQHKALCKRLRAVVAAGGVDSALLADSALDEEPGGAAGGSSSARRQLKGLDGYSGISIRQNLAAVQLGPEGDVSVARTGQDGLQVVAGKCVFTGDVHVNGTLTTGANEQSTTCDCGPLIAAVEDAACTEPQILLDPTDNSFYVCDGSDWVAVGSSSSTGNDDDNGDDGDDGGGGGDGDDGDGSTSLAISSCLEAGEEGLFFIEPAGDGEYYSVHCYADGGMRLRSTYDTYSTYYSTCGGSDDGDCLPSASDGCYIRALDGSKTTYACDLNTLSHAKSYQSIDIEYVDEEGTGFSDEALAALSKLYTSSGSMAQVWIFDAVDQNLYSLRVDFAGDTSSSSHYLDNYDADSDESWDISNTGMALPDWLGAHRIPTSISAGSLTNIGIAFVLAEGASLRLTPVTSVIRSCLGAPAGQYLIDPANDGLAFTADCDGNGGFALYPTYDSYSTYFENCGGVADGDCTPTCDDGCVMEKQSGVELSDCCDDSDYTSTSKYQQVSVTYLDYHGFGIADSQLDALVDHGIDSTDANIRVWFHDATDQNNYEVTVHFHHNTPSQTHFTDYYIGSDVNEWDINNADNPELDLLFKGVGRIPSGVNAGTLSNIGVWFNFAEGKLPLTPAPKSCAAVSFAGTFTIDPAGDGTGFPVYCDGTGQTHLMSAYDGYSTYADESCGGNPDDDCRPSCSDGCTLEDTTGAATDTCCDEGNNLAAAQYSVDFRWVDANGDDISEEQLNALAAISDSSLTSLQLFLFDSEDSGVYTPTVDFYGGGDSSAITDDPIEFAQNGWGVNTDTQYIHGMVGMHRIPKTLNAGATSSNFGVYVTFGGAALVLTADTDTRRTCVNVLTEGVYLLDPLRNGHAFPIECTIDGVMKLTPEYPTFNLQDASGCGGTDISPCAPTCDDGCVADGSSDCCADLSMSGLGSSTSIRYLDTKGQLIQPEQLDYFANNGFDTSDNDVQVWVFDAADTDGYEITADYHGDQSSVTIVTDWGTTHFEQNAWTDSDVNNPDLEFLLKGEGVIPNSLVADAGGNNFGIWVNFPNNEFLVNPPAQLTCDLITGERIVDLDPAGTGVPFPATCLDGKTLLRAFGNSYTVYYSSCGGSPDSDCAPSCAEGCVTETMDGDVTAQCCDAWALDAAQSTNEFEWVDEFGEAISSDHLDALADSMDSSWTNVQIWIFDSTDQDAYTLTTTYYGSDTDDHQLVTDYYIGEDVNEWDMNNDVQAVADGMEQFLGMHKIPDTLDAGTLSNWGVWIGLPSNYLVLSPESRTYTTCADVPSDGVFLIDPAGTGKAFPIHCGEDGTTFLTSKYTGYSVYYSSCGGSVDANCAPSCEDGCYLNEATGECCDGMSRHIAEYSDVEFAWVDVNDNLIPSSQLDALAAIDFDSSIVSSDRVWLFDASDQSGYTLTVSFYGSESDAQLVTPSDWYIGSDVNEWDISSDDTDLSELQGLFLGTNRIPKSMNAGTLSNWGVWVHFTDNQLVLTPTE